MQTRTLRRTTLYHLLSNNYNNPQTTQPPHNEQEEPSTPTNNQNAGIIKETLNNIAKARVEKHEEKQIFSAEGSKKEREGNHRHQSGNFPHNPSRGGSAPATSEIPVHGSYDKEEETDTCTKHLFRQLLILLTQAGIGKGEPRKTGHQGQDGTFIRFPHDRQPKSLNNSWQQCGNEPWDERKRGIHPEPPYQS